MNKKQWCALLLVACSGVASAATEDAWYVGVQGNKRSTSFDGNSVLTYSDIGGRIYLGNRFNDRVSLEMGILTAPAFHKTIHLQHSTREVSLMTGAADMVLLWSPLAQHTQLKLKGGMALMYLDASREEKGTYISSYQSASALTSGFVAGVSYDIPLGETINANVGFTHYHSLPDSSYGYANQTYSHNVLSFGVQKQF